MIQTFAPFQIQMIQQIFSQHFLHLTEEYRKICTSWITCISCTDCWWDLSAFLHIFFWLTTILFILAKHQFKKLAIFVKFEFQQKFKILQMLQNLQKFANFQKFQLDNLIDLQKCWKTRIYTPPLGGKETQAFCWPPKKSFGWLC